MNLPETAGMAVPVAAEEADIVAIQLVALAILLR
jgi:hypothetical protein